MFIEYRQEVVKKIALCINPSASFSTDTSNNILIPADEESVKAMLLANTIVDKLQEIFGFNVKEMSEIYQYLLERYKEISDENVSHLFDLLKIIGVSQASVK